MHYCFRILTSVFFAAGFSLLLFSFSCNGEKKPAESKTKTTEPEKDLSPEIITQVEKIKPLYDTITAAGDWMMNHPDEKFLSFDDYKKRKPERITTKRYKIYIQPIGNFDSIRNEILKTTARYLEAFFGVAVVINSPLSDTLVPDDERRVMHGNEQLKSSYINKSILKPLLPADGAVMVGFTPIDLYPSDEWNFVFGQALTKGRVGVWSVNRFGTPEKSKKDYRIFLLRALRTSSHEISHMFSLPHCVKYHCVLNGANSLEEADERPLWPCPECLQKLCWNFNVLPSEHFERMKKFWEEAGEKECTDFYEKNLEMLNKN